MKIIAKSRLITFRRGFFCFNFGVKSFARESGEIFRFPKQEAIASTDFEIVNFELIKKKTFIFEARALHCISGFAGNV